MNSSSQLPTLPRHNAFSLQLFLIFLFCLAALIRLNAIRAPGLLLDREYTSAIFARAFYFTHNKAVEDWRRDVAVITMKQQPVLEPPVVEYLVSLIYRVAGREQLYYARYLTIAFWLAGGIFMYLLGRELLSPQAAFFATVYYLFVPMGILISRSFQPDSLMMMLFLASLYLLVRYFEKGTRGPLLQASTITAITLLLRPLVLIAIFSAFLALSWQKQTNLKKIFDAPLLVFSAIGLSPATVYYGYGIVFAGYMRWKVSTSFMPHLLTKRSFWQGWFELGTHVAGTAFLIAAIIGFFMLRNKAARALIVGLAISYLIFGVVFTYHIHTHGYYHIQLFPVVGLCAGVCLASITNTLKSSSERLWVFPVILSLLIAFYFSYRQVREGLNRGRAEDPDIAWKIGETVEHSTKTVFVSYYYGLPLEYFGELGGAPWPVRIDDPFYRRPGETEMSVQERIDGLGFVPEYFVVTHFDLYERKHQDLQAYLKDSCSVQTQTSKYLIYTNCNTPSNNRASQ